MTNALLAWSLLFWLRLKSVGQKLLVLSNPFDKRPFAGLFLWYPAAACFPSRCGMVAARRRRGGFLRLPALRRVRRLASLVSEAAFPPPETEQQPKGNKKAGRMRSAFSLVSGGYLFSRAVASQVSWAYEGLTSVFGMGTGGTPQLNHRNGKVCCQRTLKTA